jgi:hypothetical protein
MPTRRKLLFYTCVDYPYLDGCSVHRDEPSGIYQISLTSNSSDCVYKRDVYCDMDTDGGGWTVSCVTNKTKLIIMTCLTYDTLTK